MEEWKRHFRRGKESLSKHSPDHALRELKIALQECPQKESSGMAKVMFYLGITLKKLGVPNGAAKSWIVAKKLNKSGYSSKMISRFVNDYGMIKQQTGMEDDWKAFHSVQLEKYLRCTHSDALRNGSERDAVTGIIWKKWEKIRSYGVLHGLNSQRKLDYFRSVQIWGEFDTGSCIPVDFNEKRRLSPEDRCACGSGLSYGKCCGRIKGVDELYSGVK